MKPLEKAAQLALFAGMFYSESRKAIHVPGIGFVQSQRFNAMFRQYTFVRQTDKLQTYFAWSAALALPIPKMP